MSGQMAVPGTYPAPEGKVDDGIWLDEESLDTDFATLASPTFTGNVKVPDANADGEPIAYDQAGWRLAGGTLTGDVSATSRLTANYNVDYTDAIRAGSVTIRRAATDPAKLSLNVQNAGGATVFSVTSAGSVIVPAAADGDTQTASRTTAKDSTTGQVQVNGVEVGDTGWRDVSADLHSTVSSGEIFVRRIGNTVHFSVNDVEWTTPDAGQRSLLAAGVWSGFECVDLTGTTNGGHHFPLSRAVSAGSEATTVNFCELIVRRQPNNVMRTLAYDSLYGVVSWPTDEAWPASLPGTAV